MSDTSEEAHLKELGYDQELSRRMSAFSNFAMSFSVICILAGGLTSLHLGLFSVGGASVGLGWPFACFFSVCTAMAMGQIASAFPTAGGVYHWSSILGGKAWGWLTALFNLAGLTTVLSAINVGVYLFAAGCLGVTPDPEMQLAVVVGITFTQAVMNHLGIRITSFLIDCSGYLILAVTAVLVLALTYYSAGHDFMRLFTFTNNSGTADIWPRSENLAYVFLLGLLLPAYTVTGFDAAANTAEETLGASVTVPKSIVFAVISSSFFGWLLLATIVMAIPDMKAAESSGGTVFFYTMNSVLPHPLCLVLYLGICICQYLCGLATMTSASRMVYAFARDGGLPASASLRQVSERYLTPVNAIWTVACLSVAFAVYTPVYSTITSVCTIFLYVSYVLPIAIGLLAFGKSWTTMGPWDIGEWFRLFALLAVIGCTGLVFIGVQPPNQRATIILLGFLAVAALIWFGHERNRFQGAGHAPADVGTGLSPAEEVQ